MEQFDIQIDDESETLSSFATEQNTSSMELHDWQKRATDFFFKHNEALMEVATGSGKTFCAISILKKILEKEPELHCLIVVPKNVILETGWYKELYNAGISLRDIGVYYGAVKEYAKVTITNMQSLDKISLEVFDIVCFDEIHNYGTAKLLPYITGKKHKFKYKIGLSATLERMDNTHWNIIEAFNYNTFKYSPREALQDGVLNPFKFANIAVEMDLESYEKYLALTKDINTILLTGGGFNKIMRMNSGLKNLMLAKMNERKNLVNNYEPKFDVAKEICKKHPDDKIIIFNEYNSQTSKLYWYLLDIGVKACMMHSGINKEKREQALIDYKNDKYNVMLASKVLDEGYDLPSISVGVIMAGNSTNRQTVQRLGRVLRRKSKESMLYQIYCAGTIEEDYSMSRAKLFKELCSDYRQFNYNRKELDLKWQTE